MQLLCLGMEGAWMLPGCWFGGWKRHFSHIWLGVLQLTEFLSGRQRGRNNLQIPLLEQTSASYFPNWVVFVSPHCWSWRAGPANTLDALFQACWSCFARERERSACRGYSQRWQSLECPLWVLTGKTTLLLQSFLLWDFAALANKKPWEQLFCSMVIVSLILPVTSLYFLRVWWWILRRWNYGERWQVLCVSFFSKEYFAGNWIAPRLCSAVLGERCRSRDWGIVWCVLISVSVEQMRQSGVPACFPLSWAKSLPGQDGWWACLASLEENKITLFTVCSLN